MKFESSAPAKRPVKSRKSTPRKSNGARDELRPEYDFRSLPVVARGPGRSAPRETSVLLAPDVARTFPDSDSVNEALRLLIRVAEGQGKRRSARIS